MNDIETIDEQEQDTQVSGAGDSGPSNWLYWLLGVLLGTSLLGWIHSYLTNRKLKKEREKNRLYQEVIRKHQAEIDALKNAKKREEYKNRLWEELKSRSEGEHGQI